MGSENSKSEHRDRLIAEAQEVTEVIESLSNLLTSDQTRSRNSVVGEAQKVLTFVESLSNLGKSASDRPRSQHSSMPSAPQSRSQPQTSRQHGTGQYSYSQYPQTTGKQAAQSHPTLERTRSPYNFTNQDLYTKKEKSPTTLYPNLNTSRPSTPVQRVQSPATPVNTNVNYSSSENRQGGRSDAGGFVVVGLEQSRTRPKPSAPPAPELTVPELSVSSPPPQSSVRPNNTPSPVTPGSTYVITAANNSRPISRPNNTPSPASTSVNTAANNTRPISRGRAADDQYNCPTCSQRLGTTIFQCETGHGSCQGCRQARRWCGKCGAPLTNTRNIMLEGLVAELLLVTKTPCPNIGCILRFNDMDMQNHLNECPFGETDCPMGKIFGQCSCRFKIDDLVNHFDAFHKEQLTANVGKEMFIFNICMETQKVFLVKIGPYHFLVHVKVSDVDRKIYIAVQLFGTVGSASKWSYEVHVYNKRQPRRKFHYEDNCLSISTPVHEIFKESKCAVLPLSYAMTFVNESSLTYKFFIKKNEGNWRQWNRGKVNRQQIV